MTMTDDVTALFAVLTDTAFGFLPVLIAYSATRKFGGNPLFGIVVGLMMVAPQLPNAYAVRGGTAEAINVFGIDIYGYQGSIFPAILAGWMVSRLERWLRTWVPQIMDLIVTPFLTITTTIAVILFILGPIIQVVEGAVINSIMTLINAPFGIGYVIYAPQTFEDEKGRLILWAWMGIGDIEPEYSNPTVARGWQHAMALPRQLTFENYKLKQRPLPEYQVLRANQQAYDLTELTPGSLTGEVYELLLEFEDTPKSLEISLRQDTQMTYQDGIFTLKH